ncbi:MAG TPA: DNA-processing protein DprA, partial [Woeseiaceae bacterium]|nr:DNA-processing protein DprA [Woeseiaceae bacterium]
MQQDRRPWLILAHAHLRVSDLQALLDLFGTAEAIVDQPRSRLAEAGLSDAKCTAITSPDERAIAEALSWLDHAGHHLVAWGDGLYPEMLAQIPGPPLLLYVNGDIDALHLPALAIVGSRNPTQGGSRNAHNFAKHLAGRGFAIVSGLAQGIDAAAHEGAIDAGGKTVAFLGTGIDRIYPATNRNLAHAIAANSAL